MLESNATGDADAYHLARLLADDLVWRLFPLLATSDVQLGEVQARLGAPREDLEERLTRLSQLGIIDQRVSDVDAGTRYVRLQVERLRTTVQHLISAIHPSFQLASLPEPAAFSPMRPRVLFLCTENSARSQLAEALLRRLSKGAVEAYSAGTQPGVVHPRVLDLLGVEREGLRSKHLDEFAGQHFDYVVTVCDKVREICPSFAGADQQVHWSIPDPAAVIGSEEQQRAFEATVRELTQRIRYLLIFIERNQRTTRPEVSL
jgi:protein-tyrosine-phosphatase